jgi:hypothetical protein
MEVWLKERVLQRYVIETCTQFKVNGYKAVRARDNKDKFPDVYFTLENNEEVPVEVEWQTTNFIQHGHDLNVIKENNGCVIVCNNNLDLGKVQQIKIDIKKFEDWFEKNAKRIIQDTTEPYKKKDNSRTNPKLWLTYISLKAGGDSDFKKALKAKTWGVQKNYSQAVINQITQINKGDLIVFIGPGKGFPDRVNIKNWSRKTFKGYFQQMQVFRITSDYFYDEEKIIWEGVGKWKDETFPHRFEFDSKHVIDVKNIQIRDLTNTTKQELHSMVYSNFIEGDSATMLDCIFHAD